MSALRTSLANRYEIQREIGQGAHATVYRALDLRHDRLVAIKVLNVDPDSEFGEVRFVREIKWLAQMQHPNILPLHDSGHVGNLLYFITPYLGGESLAERIHRERRLSVRDAVRITLEIADALQYAHSCGVVHRDIKPANILLSGSHAVVADFGVARAIDSARAHHITKTGPGSPGTPAYMSPEQLLGGRNIDQRSDIYAVGCVLYEMLAGRAPFVGKEGFVRRFTEPPPSLRDIRPDVPAALDALLARALATDPESRFSSASEFARALESLSLSVEAAPERRAAKPLVSSPSAPSIEADATPAAPRLAVPTTEPWRHSRLRVTVVGGFLFVVAVAAVLLTRSARTPALDDNLLAVAPFSLFGADTIWREGLTDVLVRNLDGAGPLRTAPAALSLQHWSGYSDRSSAESLGRALHAGLVVYGSVMRAGTDSVRVTANVLDLREQRLLPTLQWQDATAHIDRVTDSVTLGILRQIGERLGVQSLSHLSLASSTTLPALKEFLQGEQYFRRTAWDSALASYRRAIDADSSFALAWWRAGIVQAWRGFLREARAYKQRAGALNRGLGPRDSLLIAGDDLFGKADAATDDEQTWNLSRAMDATLEEATRRYPDDAEAWYLRGEALFHFPSPLGGVGARDVAEMFEHSIALDSTFAPSYLHAIELAFQFNEVAHARRLIDLYLQLQPTDPSATPVRIVRAVTEDGVQSAPARQAMASASLVDLHDALDFIGLWPDSGEQSIGVARQLLAAANKSAVDTDRVSARYQLARQLAVRGHLRNAYRILTGAYVDSMPRARRLIGELAQFDIFPPDTVRALVERFRRVDVVGPRVFLPWFAANRDTAMITSIGRDAARLGSGHPSVAPGRLTEARYTVQAAHAYLALANADTVTAVRLFGSLPDSLCRYCFIDRWKRAELFRATGHPRDAARAVREMRVHYRAPGTMLVLLEEARIARELGDVTAARDAYTRVLGTWRHPDPELEPLVREARTALQALPAR